MPTKELISTQFTGELLLNLSPSPSSMELKESDLITIERNEYDDALI